MAIRRSAPRALGVSEVARYLRALFEDDSQLQDLWITGEIAEFKQAPSGHCYLTLKDASAILKCVMYRQIAQHMPRVRVGSQVLLHGTVGIYEPRGELQIGVDHIEEAGVGLLYQRFLALKEELEDLGVFALERKRAIPTSPRIIGIVTSGGAAALRDMVRTLRLRWPLARVVLAPTLVQGNEAPAQIVRALEWLNRHGAAEVIIIARGGGSIEDLWAFNDRAVALAIAASRIPTVTGIGHETDFTIADFVADYRAATPTAAAAHVSPDIAGLQMAVTDAQLRLLGTMQADLTQRREGLAVAARRLAREHPHEQLDRKRQDLDGAVDTLRTHMTHRLALARERLSGFALQLQSLSPLLTIGRGFATIRRASDGAPVSSVADVAPMEDIAIQVRDGQIQATVTGVQVTWPHP